MVGFKNFDLKIRGEQAAGYTVEAVGPAGESASADLNWTPLADLAADLQAIQIGAADRAALERVGTALFHALFPLQVLMVHVAVMAQLGEEEGLRLRLHLPPELERLPWELLYYPPFYLSTDPRHPVVRFLDLPDTPRPLAVQPPLRLLHLLAAPVDATGLDVEREAAQLHSALADLAAGAAVDIIPARPGTLAALHDGLLHEVHVLHFSGHGTFEGGHGCLLFEGEYGRSQPVDGDTLAHLLRGSEVRLAVLNACESARAGESDAFGSVAAALIRAGLPAVVAHQFAMPDSSAIPFVGDFYRALAAGFPVDAAVAEGRKAVLAALGSAWRDRVDWAAPVLLMRAPDGHLFALPAREEAGGARQPTAPVVYQQVFAQDDAATIGTITGGTVNIDFSSPPTGRAQAAAAPADPLPALLDQLRRMVRDHAPQARRTQALEKVAILRDAAGDESPDLPSLEAVLRWFEAELPSLSGAVLSAILSFEARAERAGDEILIEFRRRFGPPG